MRNIKRRQSGFTLIEILTVLVIIGVLAAVAVPTMRGFIEYGKQKSRMNIARTLYLAAQNQLTEMRIAKNLQAFNDSAAAIKLDPDNLTTTLASDMANIYYISKPKNADTDNPVYRLLNPVVLDKNVLNDAILIEYNIKSGVVLSVFYSDLVDELDYNHADIGANVSGDRIYTLADARKQGYYGAGGTSVPGGSGPGGSDPIEPPKAVVFLHDSAESVLNGFSFYFNDQNALYARILVEERRDYQLYINNKNANVSFDFITTVNSNTFFYAGTVADTDPQYAGYHQFIWVLDHVGNSHDICIDDIYTGNLTDLANNITVGIRGSGVDATSNPQHPYFYSETSYDYKGGYKIASPRHLSNIRHIPNKDFTQIRNIDFGSSGHNITNFTPITSWDTPESNPVVEKGFSGTYNGTGYAIKNLRINNINNNIGLFGTINRSATGEAILGLTLENPTVTGGENVGAVVGKLDAGVIKGTFVRFTNDSAVITGTKNVGGIIGIASANGTLTDSSFVSASPSTHTVPVAGVTDTQKNTVGGLVGDNTGTLTRNILLAVAPVGADGSIRPITGINSAPTASIKDVYYLYGAGLWPLNTENYNTGILVGVGEPRDTLTIKQMQLTGWGNKQNLESLSPESVLKIDDTGSSPHPVNTIYPYPLYDISVSQIGECPPYWWPLTNSGSIELRNFFYYEKYEISGQVQYGLYNGIDNEPKPDDSESTTAAKEMCKALQEKNIIRDSVPVLEAGYVIIVDSPSRPMGLHLYTRTGDTTVTVAWKNSDHTTELAFEPGTNYGFEEGNWVCILDLDVLEAKQNPNDKNVPIQLAYGLDDAASEVIEIDGYIHPLFAKAVYDIYDHELGIAGKAHIIRTPWQLTNINHLPTGYEKIIKEAVPEIKPDPGSPGKGSLIAKKTSETISIISETDHTNVTNPGAIEGFHHETQNFPDINIGTRVATVQELVESAKDGAPEHYFDATGKTITAANLSQYTYIYVNGDMSLTNIIMTGTATNYTYIYCTGNVTITGSTTLDKVIIASEKNITFRSSSNNHNVKLNATFYAMNEICFNLTHNNYYWDVTVIPQFFAVERIYFTHPSNNSTKVMSGLFYSNNIDMYLFASEFYGLIFGKDTINVTNAGSGGSTIIPPSLDGLDEELVSFLLEKSVIEWEWVWVTQPIPPTPGKPFEPAITDSRNIHFLQERHMDFDTDGSDTTTPNNGGAGTKVDLTGQNAVVTGYYFDDVTSVRKTGFCGVYDGNFKSIDNVKITNDYNDVGLFVSNSGVIKNVILKNAIFKGKIQAGAIAAVNTQTGDIAKCGVEYSTVTGEMNVGGITGDNAGIVEDVYFLSVNSVLNVPVAGTTAAGGIIGRNDGAVERALYLAPALHKLISVADPEPGEPTEIDCIFPIVGDGNDAVKTLNGKETCFYLAGNSYSLDGGKNWNIGSWYNLSSSTVVGGGKASISGLIEVKWLDYYTYGAMGSGPWRAWKQSTNLSLYPYPVLGDFPTQWPAADSPDRPDQFDRLENDPDPWKAAVATTETERLGFENGDFDEPFTDPNNKNNTLPVRIGADNTGNLNFMLAPYGSNTKNGPNINGAPGIVGNAPPLYNWVTAYNETYGWAYFLQDWINAWNTKPVAMNYETDIQHPWYVIELHKPQLDNSAWGRFTRTNYRGDKDGVYAELNSTTQSILYQNCKTVPGTEMYYSFYHAARGWGAPSATNPEYENMSFCLSSIVKNEYYSGKQAVTLTSYDYTTNEWRYANAAAPGETPEAGEFGTPTVVRPCVTNRGDYMRTPKTRNTVDYSDYYYGPVQFYDPHTETFITKYLYDVWVGSIDPETSATQARGYGISFWLDTPNDALKNTHGYTLPVLLNALGMNEAALEKQIIGYWDVPSINYEYRNSGDTAWLTGWQISEWKQYYGRYIIPTGQTMTEFGFKSDKASNQTIGNYLDGISFKTPGQLSVNKMFKDAAGENQVSYAKQNDILTVEINVVNWGEADVDSITLKDRLAPFDTYMSYEGSLSVSKISLIDMAPENDTGTVSYTPSLPDTETGTSNINDRTLWVDINTPLAGVERIPTGEKDENGQKIYYNKYHGYKITFKAKIRSTVNNNMVPPESNGSSTLLYYINNQAEINYYDAGYPCYSSTHKAFKDYGKQNASVVDVEKNERQVHIGPIVLSRTVAPTVIDALNDGAVDGTDGNPFTTTFKIEIADADDVTSRSSGMVNILIPNGFTVDQDSFVELIAGVPTDIQSNYNIHLNADGTTDISIFDIHLGPDDVRYREFRLRFAYKGTGYGVALTSIGADYKCEYENTNMILNEPLLLLLSFPKNVVGITVKTVEDKFIFNEGANYFDILANDNFANKLSEYGYTVMPEVVLLLNDKPVDFISTPEYSISYDSIRGLVFAPATDSLLDLTASYEVTYQILLKAVKIGGKPVNFVLSSKPTTVRLIGKDNPEANEPSTSFTTSLFLSEPDLLPETPNSPGPKYVVEQDTSTVVSPKSGDADV